MGIELGGEIHGMGAKQSRQDSGSGSRRNPHQQKLKALIAALQTGDLAGAKACYADLLTFNPALASSHFQRVGHALASGNLSGAQRVIVEIYGQSQMIFTAPIAAMPATAPRQSMRDDFGVLVDVSA